MNSAVRKAYGDDTLYQRAVSVINAAKRHDLYTGEIPEDKEVTIGVAERIAEKARIAREKGNTGNAVTEILYTYEVEIGSEPNDNNGEDEISEEEKKYQRAVKEFTRENLPIPPEIPGNPPVLPLDFTNETPKEIRRLHSAFNACAARVGYLLAVEEAGEKAAKHIANGIYSKWLIEAERRDPQTARPKTKEVLEAEAMEDNEKLIEWRERQNEHAVKAGKLKSLFDYYDDSADRLNKEAIMRQMERE